MPYKDPEKEKERNRRRWRENKEVMRQRNKEYYENNKEAIAKKFKKWQAGNRDKFAISSKKYQQSPKGKFTTYKANAKVRDIDFELSFEEFASFWQKDCHYCGGTVKSIGLDRLDSFGKYELGNVVPCCGDCNYMKSQKNKTAFIEHCAKILIHQGFTIEGDI